MSGDKGLRTEVPVVPRHPTRLDDLAEAPEVRGALEELRGGGAGGVSV